MKVNRLGLLAILTLLTIAASLFIGWSTGLGARNLWRADSVMQVVLDFRLPRALGAVLAGAGLANCGLLLQVVLHNPLASPFTLGSSAGASFGFLMAMVLGVSAGWLLGLSAFAGALAVTVPIALVALRRRMPMEALLLGGVAINFGVSALSLALAMWAPANSQLGYLQWSFGSVGGLSLSDLPLLLAVLLPVLLLPWLMRFQLDGMLSGPDLAVARAVRVPLVRALAIGAVGLAVGAIVASCGPITFVGLVVPHVARGLFGASMTRLAWATPLLGAMLLVIADWLGGNMGYWWNAGEVPIGVMSALLGAPAFIVLLALRSQRSTGGGQQ